MADELGGWRHQEEPEVGKLRWKRAETKSVSWSTEAVFSPVIGLMEALHFWHLLAEVCFHTFVEDTQTQSDSPLSVQKFCSDRRCLGAAVGAVASKTEP